MARSLLKYRYFLHKLLPNLPSVLTSCFELLKFSSTATFLCPKHSNMCIHTWTLGFSVFIKGKLEHTMFFQLNYFGFCLYLLAGQGEQDGSRHSTAKVAKLILLP